MRQGLFVHDDVDENGNPTGGTVVGVGVTISWQRGPLGRGAHRQPPNGAFVEDVIDAARQRLMFYQAAIEGRFACTENAEAIQLLEAALRVLDARTKAREAREVEGTHTP
jgi:hypothetical protein